MSKLLPTDVARYSATFFVLRSPLLPINHWLRWSEIIGTASPNRGTALPPEGWPETIARLRSHLGSIVALSEFQEALFLSSPSLLAGLDEWHKNPSSKQGQKVERSLVKYLARASARSTPFGLWAGQSVGHVGATTELNVGPRNQWKRHVRLDMEYVNRLTDHLADDPSIRRWLTYFPASTIYRVGTSQIRYVGQRSSKDGREYELVAVDANEELETALALARCGAKHSEIVEGLAREFGASTDEAVSFVDELITSQLLVSDIVPKLTGPEPLEGLVTRVGPTSTIGKALATAANKLAALESANSGVKPEQYEDIANALSALPERPDPGRFLQVDLTKPPSQTSLGGDIVAKVLAGVDVLHRLARPGTGGPLDVFREAFRERYGDAQVPLGIAVDSDLGIGFGGQGSRFGDNSELLDGLSFKRLDEVPGPRWTTVDAMLLERVTDAKVSSAREIRIEEAHLRGLPEPSARPLPTTFCTLATVAKHSSEADYQICLEGAWGPGGVPLLGRFCHVDRELHSLVQRFVQQEQANRHDVVFAEIVHLPQTRLGNVVMRPLLRDYEIPFAGTSGAPLAAQLPLDDLLVSVEGNRVVLRSRRLCREIVPRMSTAHFYGHSDNLALYRFLCMLQLQGLSFSLTFDWGPLGSLPFLPRVRYRDIILAPARWRMVGRDKISALSKGSLWDQYYRIQEMRQKVGLPRFVRVPENDQWLLVDLDNPLSISAFTHSISTRTELIVEELLPNPSALDCQGDDGSYFHEILVPFIDARQQQPSSITQLHSRQHPVRLTLGDDWLYVKVYGGPSIIDRLLTETLTAVLQECHAAEGIDRWFFIRYGDPDWHLRLRIHGRSDQLDDILKKLLDSIKLALSSEIVWRFQIDTYVPEIERYGGPQAMPVCESIFCADSQFVLEALALLRTSTGMISRWQVTLLSVYALFIDFGMSESETVAALEALRDDLAQKLQLDPTYRRSLGEKFRKDRNALSALLFSTDESNAAQASVRGLLRDRSHALAPFINQLRLLEGTGELTVPVRELVKSLVHMHVNRMVRADANLQEIVIYDFLLRLLERRRHTEFNSPASNEPQLQRSMIT